MARKICSGMSASSNYGRILRFSVFNTSNYLKKPSVLLQFELLNKPTYYLKKASILRPSTPPKNLLGCRFLTPYILFCLISHVCTELFSILLRFEWARVDIRWFSVDVFDTRWIPICFLCGKEAEYSAVSQHSASSLNSSLYLLNYVFCARRLGLACGLGTRKRYSKKSSRQGLLNERWGAGVETHFKKFHETYAPS